jgi:hypothetical protein
MFAHGLHPVQTQRVQHSRCAFHDDKDGDGKSEPDGEEAEDGEDAKRAAEGEGVVQRHIPEHDRELLMGKRKSPKA